MGLEIPVEMFADWVIGEFMLQLHHAMLGSRLHVVPGSQGTLIRSCKTCIANAVPARTSPISNMYQS